MPSTWSKLLLHIVFSTKHRQPLITPEIAEHLYPYIGGIIRALDGSLYTIGGMPDHVHLLIRWRTDGAISGLMRTAKARSSLWVHQTFAGASGFAWQEGYAAFSVSRSGQAAVQGYIENQEEHHRRRDFKEELLALLCAHDIEFNPRYID